MEDQNHTTDFTLEIDNFLEKKSVKSPKFLSGGCEWFVKVYPKVDDMKDHMRMCLCVGNRRSLGLGWKRRVNFSFVVLNQSLKELHRFDEKCRLFFGQFGTWSLSTPVEYLQEKGFLAKNKLILKVEVKVLEVVDEGDVIGDEMLDFNGFQVLYSEVFSLKRLFMEHPDIARNFKAKDQVVRTRYLNILLGIIETLNNNSITETELSNAQSELMKLTEAGFKLNWLKKKHYEISLERKIAAYKEKVKEKEKEKEKAATCGAREDWLEGLVRSWNEWRVRMWFVGSKAKKNKPNKDTLMFPLLGSMD